MKILFLAHRTPYPPDKGEKIRSYNIICQLAHRHSLSLAYWVDDARDVKHVNLLSRICQGKILPIPLDRVAAKLRALKSLIRGKSFTEGYYYSSGFQKAIDALVKGEPPDLIYVFSSAMAPYVHQFHSIPRIIDFVDVDSDKWGQLSEFSRFPLKKLYRLEQLRLGQLEISASRWAESSLFVSQREAEFFRQMGGWEPIVSLPNGVNTDASGPPLLHETDLNGAGHGRDPRRPITLLFVGTMNYYPNSDAVSYFAREILPRIRRSFPQAIFEIVGRNPPRSVRGLEKYGGIRVRGEVDDIQSYLRQADVSVAPIRIARGVQNKVLEAMAVGVPVVATSEAIKGIRVSHGEEVLVGDSPETFAEQVLRLLSENQLAVNLSRKAWKRVREDYNWRTIGACLDELIQGGGATLSKGVA